MEPSWVDSGDIDSDAALFGISAATAGDGNGGPPPFGAFMDLLCEFDKPLVARRRSARAARRRSSPPAAAASAKSS